MRQNNTWYQFYLVVQTTAQVSPELWVNGEIAGVFNLPSHKSFNKSIHVSAYLKDTPVLSSDASIVNLGSFVCPMVHCKEKRVSITDKI